MKCRVIKGFIDRITDIPYSYGDVYECDKKRFEEINSKGDYLVATSEKSTVTANMKPEKALEK